MFLDDIRTTPESHGWHRITRRGNGKTAFHGWPKHCMLVLDGGSPSCCWGRSSPAADEWRLREFGQPVSVTTFRTSISSCRVSVESERNWGTGCWCSSCRSSKTRSACFWPSTIPPPNATDRRFRERAGVAGLFVGLLSKKHAAEGKRLPSEQSACGGITIPRPVPAATPSVTGMCG